MKDRECTRFDPEELRNAMPSAGTCVPALSPAMHGIIKQRLAIHVRHLQGKLLRFVPTTGVSCIVSGERTCMPGARRLPEQLASSALLARGSTHLNGDVGEERK